MSPYLVLEGGDGTGKSHQARALRDWFLDQGEVVQHLREPGSTATGEAIRRLLLAKDTGGLSPWTEALLFSAARAEMLEAHVRPALRRGEVVLVERCYLSTMAYQCLAPPGASSEAGAGADLEILEQITRAVHGETWPDRILLLDVDAATRRARSGDASDRIEALSEDFHQRVRQAYLDLAAKDPRVTVVDAGGEVQEVQERLRAHAKAVLAEVRS